MLSQLRQHSSRYAAAGVAIALCSLFVTLSLSFVQVIQYSFYASTQRDIAGASLVLTKDLSTTAVADDSPVSDEFLGAPARVAQAVQGDGGNYQIQPVRAEYHKVRLTTKDGSEPYLRFSTLKPATALSPFLVDGSLPQLEPFNPSLASTPGAGDPPALSQAAKEVVIDTNAAKQFGLKVGDSIPVSWTVFDETNFQELTHDIDLRIVAIIEGSLLSYSTVYIQPNALTAISPEQLQQVAVYTPADADLAAVRRQIEANLGAVPIANFTAADIFRIDTPQEYVESATGGTDGQSNLLLGSLALIFPALATVVGIVVVGTTFQVMLTARTNELALLRCVGASKSQIRRMVIAEALTLGLVAAAIGTVSAVAIATIFMLVAKVTTTVLTALWVIGWFPLAAGIFTGLLMTVCAAWRPASAATRTDPLIALRPIEDAASEPPKRRLGRKIFASLLTAGGGLVLAWALYQSTTDIEATERAQLFAVGLLGGIALFLGLLMVLTVLSPRIVRLVTAPFAARSLPVQLARDNIVRQPRRASATIAAVVMGVTMVTTIVVGTYAVQATLGRYFTINMPLDLALAAADPEKPISPKTAQQIADLPGITASEKVAHYHVTVANATASKRLATWSETQVAGVYGMEVFAVPADTQVLPASAWALKPGQIGLPAYRYTNDGWNGDRVELELNGVKKSFTAVPTHFDSVTVLASDFAEFAAQAPSIPVAFPPLTPEQIAILENNGTVDIAPQFGRLPDQLWLKADPALHGEELSKVVQSLVPFENQVFIVTRGAQMRAEIEYIISVIMWVLLALLAATIIVALIGVMNTLSLAVVARRRETAMLRAIGLTRSQLRQSVLSEAMLIGGLATCIGIGLGIGFAFAGLQLLPLSDRIYLSFSLPWLQVAVIALAGLSVTYLSSIIPARMAARTTPIEALQHT